MLNLTTLKQQWREVIVSIPDENTANGFKTAKFRALFKLGDTEQFKQWTNFDAESEFKDDEVSANDATKILLDNVLLDVKDVEVEEGEDALEMVKTNVWCLKGLIQAYLTMYNGADKANLKKSRK